MIMKGRYLLKNNNEHEELVYYIADFLWNNGDEVIVENNFTDVDYYSHFLYKKPWIVTVHADNFSKTVEKMKGDGITSHLNILHFSSTGVFTNLIPFPHQIFKYENLNTAQLSRFFNWCLKLNLFNI